MAVQQLNFQGINRAITDYSSTTACEELINLRPTGTGLVPVKPFSVKMAGVQYKKVFVHKSTNKTNYIGVYGERDTTYVKLLDDNGQAITTLFTISQEQVGQLVPFDNVIATMHFAYVGNYILFSIKDDADEFYANYAFLWSGTAYEEREANVPPIDASFSVGEVKSVAYTGGPVLLDESIAPNPWYSRAELADIFMSSMNALQDENEDLCFGPIIVAIAFKTTDGETFWTNQWYLYNPLSAQKTGIIAANEDNAWIPQSDIPEPEKDEFPDGAFKFYRELSADPQRYHYYYGTGVVVNMNIASIDPSLWSEGTSAIASVEIYSTKPVYYLDAKQSLMYQFADLIYGKNLALSPSVFKEMDFDTPLYLQKSIPVRDLVGIPEPYSFPLKFGGVMQTTNTTLEIDAGAVTRHGDMLAYNSRFHFYDSKSKAEIGMPDFCFPSNDVTVPHEVFVVYNDGFKDTRLYLGQKNLSNDNAIFVIAPTIRIKEVSTQYYSQADSLWIMRTYHLNASTRYNYSYTQDEPDYEEYPIKKYKPEDYPYHPILADEKMTINVSEQYNPFVFDVEHSYLAPGNILDVQPQMVAVRDVSFGDYPLNVFTDRGVYALLQGSGKVLYGNFRSVSNLITTSNSIPTELGTFFIAAGGLWLVTGDNAVLVSDALSLGPHKFLRDCTGFQAIEAQAVPVDNLLSDPTFEVYVNGATLSYNRFRDELIVSNTDYFYSYVLSLKYRQWFKIGVKMIQDVPGSNVATVPLPGNTMYNIVDFSDETEDVKALVHLQSRPFSFSGYMYSHIHRAISMVRAALSNTDVLVVSLYGSDDLQEWVLLSYAGQSSKSQDTPLCISQLRTPPAARSWRYYTICIGGTIPTDTDFGPVMLEYQPVIRRLG